MKHVHRWIFALIGLVAVFAAPTILAAAPTGASPNAPLMVPTGSQTIASNTTQRQMQSCSRARSLANRLRKNRSIVLKTEGDVKLV